ncbi:hypothetical protein B0A49_09681 [Cryomyces minteri]|uniref:FAD-binding PCMH-type domain-containing protein n=1 Tax=Cryomyces minteri TaxID=331657 RepID=A0A4U0WNR0_9PEZI|nr:hypothetical protein B0A49_09681 [Cryomyces minteri]
MSNESTTTAPPTLYRDGILRDILENVERYSQNFDKVNYKDLKEYVLKPVLEERFDPEVQIRGFVRALRPTPWYQEAFSKIGTQELKDQIDAFADGASPEDAIGKAGFQVSKHPSPGIKHHFSLITALRKLVVDIHDDIRGNGKTKRTKGLPIVYEDAKKAKVMEVVSDVPFENWGQNINNTPKHTFLPTTVLGVQNLINWSSIFSQNKEILVSFVNLLEVTTVPDPMAIRLGQFDGQNEPELRTIELKETVADKKRLCRIGVAVTSEDFRRWAVAHNAWCLPVDVILVEVTIGGTNAPICHGAGRRHKTISDYVRRIEYVDCNAERQTVDDKELIKAAAGCFGLLGVVTHITFELDAMTYAIMEPRKIDIGLAIPPLKKEDIPSALRSEWYHATDAEAQIRDATADFRRRATFDYYSEWFWFTYQKKAWVNTWNTTESATDVVEYPDEGQTLLQWIEGWIGGVLTSHPFFKAIPGFWQAQFLATLSMATLPPAFGEDATPTIKTALPNALHFRRGTQNMRVRDMELQIPLPPHPDDSSKPDFSIVQRAWWDVINLVYSEDATSHDGSSPMRLTLELRIMGGSDILMAPQRGNGLGTASIEVLTIPDAVEDGEWQEFTVKVADLWLGLGGNVRPHWAKEWEGVRLKGTEPRQCLRTVAFKDQISEFKSALRPLVKGRGGL